jgi:hypothetical protein
MFIYEHMTPFIIQRSLDKVQVVKIYFRVLEATALAGRSNHAVMLI